MRGTMRGPFEKYCVGRFVLMLRGVARVIPWLGEQLAGLVAAAIAIIVGNHWCIYFPITSSKICYANQLKVRYGKNAYNLLGNGGDSGARESSLLPLLAPYSHLLRTL
ncbi:uncharacterized protein EI90DRAFT_3044595 [Cantharellus anzutake]|uniref:uncharacterized protein n=1 Tax=Cantharellus anzutake TaxID=1750568 RepID=UPI0019071B6D|nr:uncharacterized protein EI90DRAFT_3044595 [Cantharellus anzutake]KAF8337025.1 hypothetical protein EI90DRAFT_3044595 [Cantharellus anzutake]